MYRALKWQPSGVPVRTFSGNIPVAMIEGLKISSTVFREFVQHVQGQKLWDSEWVDEACDPPETFAVGRFIEETLSASIANRRILEIMMDRVGFQLHDIYGESSMHHQLCICADEFRLAKLQICQPVQKSH